MQISPEEQHAIEQAETYTCGRCTMTFRITRSGQRAGNRPETLVCPEANCCLRFQAGTVLGGGKEVTTVTISRAEYERHMGWMAA